MYQTYFFKVFHMYLYKKLKYYIINTNLKNKFINTYSNSNQLSYLTKTMYINYKVHKIIYVIENNYDAKTICSKLYTIKLKYKCGYRIIGNYKYH